jgi:hypothetical protein
MTNKGLQQKIARIDRHYKGGCEEWAVEEWEEKEVGNSN